MIKERKRVNSVKINPSTPLAECGNDSRRSSFGSSQCSTNRPSRVYSTNQNILELDPCEISQKYQKNQFFQRKMNYWLQDQKKRIKPRVFLEDFPGTKEVQSRLRTTHRKSEQREISKVRQLVSELRINCNLPQ